MAEEKEKLHTARECSSDPDSPPPTCIISEDICEAAGIRYADAFFDVNVHTKVNSSLLFTES